MKTVVVYYSLSGNVRKIAEELQKRLACELVEIHLQKEFQPSSAIDFVKAGKSSVFEEIPVLAPYSIPDDREIDQVVLGMPIWAGNVVPAIRSFLSQNPELKEKVQAVYYCHSGGGAKKAHEKLLNLLQKDNLMKMELVNPIKNQSYDEELTAFVEEVSKRIDNH